MKIPALSIAISFTALAAVGCTPVISERGYLPNPVGEASIRIGADTKTTIQARLGDPSTQATFGDGAWYYISTTERRVAFFDPTVTKRKILALYFDKDGKVTGLKHFGLRDGHVVSFEARETPTPGREITFLQQLLNATPGVPIGGSQQQSPGK